jgi:hypothetical protein
VIPQKNSIAVGSAGHIAVFDATTAIRQSLTPIPNGHTPSLIHLTPSGNHLLIACVEWSIYHLPLKSGKPALILSLATQKKHPLENPLLSFMPAYPGTNRVPLLLVTNRLKDSVRTAYLANVVQPEKGAPAPTEKGAKSAPSKSGKELEPGAKLMLEKGKGAVALAAHPYAPILYVLTVNGELQMYQHVQGAPALVPLHQFTSAHHCGCALHARCIASECTGALLVIEIKILLVMFGCLVVHLDPETQSVLVNSEENHEDSICVMSGMLSMNFLFHFILRTV